MKKVKSQLKVSSDEHDNSQNSHLEERDIKG